ncbi:hypothetical protein Tco_0451947 [Tanacetum coccineum]
MFLIGIGHSIYALALLMEMTVVGCLRSVTFRGHNHVGLRHRLSSPRSLTELQAADHRRQTVILDLLKADHRRQRQLVEAQKIVKSLKTQMIELQRQQGPTKDPVEPELLEEASSSS